MLMQRVEELMPAVTMSPFAQVTGASSLFSQSSPMSALTTDSNYWTTISASPPPMQHCHGSQLQLQLQSSTNPQQTSTVQLSSQQRAESVLTPALLLDKLVFAEDGEQALVEEYLKQQQHQLQQKQQQPSESDSSRVKEMILLAINDDNNNDHSEGPCFPSKYLIQEELQKLHHHQQDEASKSRPRTYSIESLLGRRDSHSDFRKWTDDDPMWNENLYIEIDEVDKERGGVVGNGSDVADVGVASNEVSEGRVAGVGVGGIGGAASAEEQELAEDIRALFPFPLSITSPLNCATNIVSSCANNITPCATDKNAIGAKKKGRSCVTFNVPLCATDSVTICGKNKGRSCATDSITICGNEPKSQTSPAKSISATLQSHTDSPLTSNSFQSHPGLHLPSFPDSIFPDDVFEEEEKEEEEEEEHKKEDM